MSLLLLGEHTQRAHMKALFLFMSQFCTFALIFFLLPGAKHLSALFYTTLHERDSFITERKVIYKSENVK
jgi:hypothetical protein